MRPIKRTLIAALFIVSGALTVTGCGDDLPDEPHMDIRNVSIEPNKIELGVPFTITFNLGLWDPDNIFTISAAFSEDGEYDDGNIFFHKNCGIRPWNCGEVSQFRCKLGVSEETGSYYTLCDYDRDGTYENQYERLDTSFTKTGDIYISAKACVYNEGDPICDEEVIGALIKDND